MHSTLWTVSQFITAPCLYLIQRPPIKTNTISILIKPNNQIHTKHGTINRNSHQGWNWFEFKCAQKWGGNNINWWKVMIVEETGGCEDAEEWTEAGVYILEVWVK